MTRSPIDVPEVATRRDAVAHELLERLDLGEAARLGAREDLLARDAHLEHTALRVRHERNAAELRLERGEQLLRHPRGAQQPAAPCAIHDLDHGAGHGSAPSVYDGAAWSSPTTPSRRSWSDGRSPRSRPRA